MRETAGQGVCPYLFSTDLSTALSTGGGRSVDNRAPSETKTRGVEYCTTLYLYSPNKYFD